MSNYFGSTPSSVPLSVNQLVAQGVVGTGPDQVPTNSQIIPVGGIILWSGSVAAIPSGWALCNGSNGTPDLRDRFVVGAGNTYAVAATGGADSVTLATTQIPAHNHTASTNTTGAHGHPIDYSTAALSGAYVNRTTRSVADGGSAAASATGVELGMSNSGSHSHTVTINNTGGGGSHENRPPYYALAYIMKVS
jgi:microcystin-dependent protein